MFQRFSEFIDYIESIPPFDLTYGEREEFLGRSRKFIEQHQLVPAIPVVTVTGTNGKGSTVKALAEILVHHGLKVGTFSSPHLQCYTERFTYNLKNIDEATLLRLANKLAALTDISRWNFYFILFFINLLFCKENSLDCLILEVSIGGRLDMANILDATLVILTQVALDHTEILGDTREEIGLEKMGLLRPGIPLVCGEMNPPRTVFEKANELNCRIYQCQKHFGFDAHEDRWNAWLEHETFYRIPAPKMHIVSLTCALQAAKLLFPTLHFSENFIQTHLPNISLPGRYQQILHHGIEWVVDVSHNPAAVAALGQFLQFLPPKKTIALFGVKTTKDVTSIIEVMKSIMDDWYILPVLTRGGMDAKSLMKFFKRFSIKPKTTLNMADALQKIHSDEADSRIVVFGSFRVVAPALAYLKE